MNKYSSLLSGILLVLVLVSVSNAELVGWWKLDDGVGAVAADSAGGNNGALIGGPQWVAGWIDGGLQLDGVDDYVDLPIGPVMPTLSETTLAIWVNYGGGAAWQRIIDLGSGTANYIYVTPNAASFGNALHVAITAGNGWDEFSSSEGTLPTGEWHHITVTVSQSEATMVLYLDGEVVGSLEGIVNFVSDLGETTQNYLGKSQYEDPALNGILDDFRIYDNVLSEFDLHAIAVTEYGKAWKPDPADGEENVTLDRTLNWNQGIVSDETFELYDTHNIYFGTDANEVDSATEPLAVVTGETQYTTALDYDTTYYWRVDEVGSDGTIIKGDVWSFKSANYIVLEDFESYTDESPNEIWNTWIDGFGDNNNGSTAGYPDPDFIGGGHYVETEIVHGGLQSMPLFYDNTTAKLSEVTKSLTSLRNWTVDDVITLTLFYYGDASNAAEPMFVGVNNAIVTNADPRAALDNEWNQWDISMQEFADQGVNLSSVSSISIGLGNKANPVSGGKGHVFFDDIWLSRSEPVVEEPEPESVDPGTTNLRAYYAFSNNTQDSSGRGLNGTITGNPTFVTGPTGYGNAIAMDGAGDSVVLPIGTTISTMTDITVACWANFSNDGGSWQRLWDFGSGETSYMFLTPRMGNNGAMRFAILTETEPETNITAPATLASGWHHVAVTMDSTTMTMMIYLDGKVVAEGATPSLPSDLGVTTQNFIGRSQFAADSYYQGSIDEVRIYNRVLSRPEVLYLAGK